MERLENVREGRGILPTIMNNVLSLKAERGRTNPLLAGNALTMLPL